MSRVLTIAWREFKMTVLRKIFLIAIVGIPIAVAGVMGVVILFVTTHKEPPLVGTIAIIESTGEVAEAARTEFEPDRIARQQQEQIEEIGKQLENAGPLGATGGASSATMAMGFGRGEVHVTIEMHSDDDTNTIDALKKRIIDGDLLAVAVMNGDVLATPDPNSNFDERPTFELYVTKDIDSDHVGFIERRLGQSVVRVRARRAGLDPDEAMVMLRLPGARTRRILAEGRETEESQEQRAARQVIPMAFMMLLWISVFTSAQHLMMSMIEEKSNRVMEVLLSAVSPLQLMGGKILGHGGVGLLIVSIYSSLGLGTLIALAQRHLIDPVDIAYLFIFFFMAYFMIASIMAAVGSAVTDIREANTLITPVMFIVMIPLALWLPISQDSNGGIATAFSFIPPAIPFVMILRLTAEEAVPLWQIPVTIIWGYACVLGMVWMASKIFRIGVLMYGKPPSLLQLVKWTRYT